MQHLSTYKYIYVCVRYTNKYINILTSSNCILIFQMFEQSVYKRISQESDFLSKSRLIIICKEIEIEINILYD